MIHSCSAIKRPVFVVVKHAIDSFILQITAYDLAQHLRYAHTRLSVGGNVHIQTALRFVRSLVRTDSCVISFIFDCHTEMCTYHDLLIQENVHKKMEE